MIWTVKTGRSVGTRVTWEVDGFKVASEIVGIGWAERKIILVRRIDSNMTNLHFSRKNGLKINFKVAIMRVVV